MSAKENLFRGQVYVMDTSSLMELHNRYPESLFPTIWKHVKEMIVRDEIISHIEVHREIKNTLYPADKLLKWSNKNKKIFHGIDDCQTHQIQKIQPEYNPQYWQNEMNRPAPWADPYLIAVAICEQAIVITQENKTKANRIPPIGLKFGVKSLNLLEFFHELKIKL